MFGRRCGSESVVSHVPLDRGEGEDQTNLLDVSLGVEQCRLPARLKEQLLVQAIVALDRTAREEPSKREERRKIENVSSERRRRWETTATTTLNEGEEGKRRRGRRT